MACSCSNQTIAGLCRDCEGSLGGIVSVYLANWVPDIFTVASGAVSAVSSAVTFYEYQFRKNTGSMTSTLNIDAANGTNFVSTELNLIFSRMETKKRIEMSALAVAQVAGIVKDANGKYYALGVSEPMEASAGDGQTGTVRTDGNRYSITLTDNQISFPPLIPDSVMETVTISQATN